MPRGSSHAAIPTFSILGNQQLSNKMCFMYVLKRSPASFTYALKPIYPSGRTTYSAGAFI